MKKIIAYMLILLLLVAPGCQQKDADAAPAPTQAPPAPTAAPSPEASGEYAFTFSAQTLEGETVTEAFLGQYDLTMVNVWASWCPPCKGELGELGELYKKLPENVGFLSVTVDDAQDLPEAKALLEEHGCAFVCLDGQESPGLLKGFLSKVTAIPTTLFLDKNGNEVGQWIVGVPRSSSVTDAYMAEIQARLDTLNGK